MGNKMNYKGLKNSSTGMLFLAFLLSISSNLFAQYTMGAATAGSTTSSTVTASATISASSPNAILTAGFAYGTSSNPTTPTVTVSSPTVGAQFSHNFTGLTAAQRYYIRPFFTHSGGTVYGTQVVVYTLHTPVTGSASTIMQNFATVGATITSTTGTNAAPTARGIVYGTSPSPTVNTVAHTTTNTTAAYSVVLPNLAAGTTYYARAYVTNAGGTAYGSDMTFTTTAAPTVSYASLPLTDNFTSLGSNWATTVTNSNSRVVSVAAGGAWPQFSTTTDASGSATGGNGLGFYNTAVVGGNQKLMAHLGLNLLNKTGVSLAFPIVDYGTGGGTGQYWDSLMVYLSIDGGVTFGATGTYVAINQAPHGDGVWNNISIDISTLATNNSLTPSATSVVKFVANLARAVDLAQIKNGSYQMVYIENLKATNTGTLPVNLLSFEGEKEQGGNLLTWTTASEINNDHFELQRSIDGVNFETITVIGGQGTSYQINHYDFLDTRDFNGIVYYRLKQVDFDGTTTYSNTISISNAQAITIFKSGENAATINGENLSAVEVFDMNGKLIYSDVLNKNVSAQTIHFDANSLSQGVYFVRVLSGSETYSQKLVY
jgi:hypothetical protein